METIIYAMVVQKHKYKPIIFSGIAALSGAENAKVA
jgi:hypothetical protein